MTQGNLNFLFFFVGMFILTPTASLILNVIWELLFANLPTGNLAVILLKVYDTVANCESDGKLPLLLASA
jgi:hypothetical protein